MRLDKYIFNMYSIKTQMGPKIEQWTTPIVFELGPLFFQGLLVTYEPTKSWNEFFIWGSVLGPGPKRAPKLKK